MNHKQLINKYIAERRRLAGNFSRNTDRAEHAAGCAVAIETFAAGCRRLGDSEEQIKELLDCARQLFGLGLKAAYAP